jgi:PAS domain S-box-containing protein
MTGHKRIYLLILIMIGVTLIVTGIAIYLLFQTGMDEELDRLRETAESQARLIEAVARFDRDQSTDFPEGSKSATISQIVDAHKHYKGFGLTGEFILARREGDQIVFLLSHRHQKLGHPQPVAWDSDLAEPMRQALSGQTGTGIALDYRGEVVLAAYEKVAELDLGLVAKIDLAEVRAPFIQAGLAALGLAAVAILLGSLLFIRLSNPLVRRLEDREARLRAILDTAVDSIITIDKDGIIQSFNLAAERMFRYAAEEVLGNNVSMLMPMPFQDEHDRYITNYLKTGEKKIIGIGREVPGRRKDGSTFPMEIAVSEIFVGESRIFNGICRDITARKKVEQAVQERELALQHSKEELQALGGKLISAQEDERRRISRELHDDMNQRLAVLALDIQFAQRRLPASNPVFQTFQKLHDEVATLSDDVRHLAYQLHPSILDDLGLAVALQSFVTDFSKWEGIPVAFNSTDIPLTLPPEIASCLYRVTQESLRNVARHAQCTQVEVKLLGVDGGLRLSILDNGKGFGVEERRLGKHGLGLIGMEERVRVVQGTYEVQSAPGQGTKITVWVPIPKEKLL